MSSYDPDHDTEHHPTNDTRAERIRGIHKDSSGKLWTIYLVEADKQDEDITAFWRGEADSILVFTGLFSGIVSTFLSLSIGELQQTSGSPTLSFVANVLWLLSLVLSISSALFATLFQQWSRRYLELTQRRVAPHRRARIRGYMFSGISMFKLSQAIKIMPILLHLSIFLFFAGLVVFVWDLRPAAGYCTLGLVAVFGVCYATLTVLPYIYLNSPYSTPFSEFAWRTSQRILLAIFLLIKRLQDLSLSFLLRGKPIYQRPEDLSRWAQWEEVVRTRIKTHQKWLKDGLQKSILDGATAAPSDMDKDSLAWTLTVLDDDREFEDFVARIPGFFESDSIPHASSVMLSLISDRPSRPDQFDPILGSRINDLLKKCVPGTSPLTEQLRRNRLRVCMRTLWYFAREYNRLGDATPLPCYVRKVFANPEMSRRIQSEGDLAARLIGRCFSCLIVRKLAQDIRSRTSLRVRVNPAELSCLAAILGKSSREVVDLLSQPDEICLANIVFLISSEAHTLVEEKVPLEVLDILLKTLNMLFAEAPPDAELPPDLVAVLHKATPLGQRSRVLDLRVDRLREIVEGWSAVHDESEVTTLAVPEPESGLGSVVPTNTSDMSLQLNEDSAVRDSLVRNEI
ncbi:hypothetical protein H4582DRAFT_10897 [Lactarius indigo]|nr:hypothetical protein H4582DRAFT_10897 [Lactarius indigo]